MDANSIKIVSLNIEGDKHLDRVLPFLQSQNFDVVCLHEVLNKDIPIIKNALGMDGKYYPSVYFGAENRGGITPDSMWGILTLTNNTKAQYFSHTYVGNERLVPIFDNDDFNTVNRVLAGIEYPLADTDIRIFTTHFTWTPDGKTTDEQRNDYESLSSFLNKYEDFVLCGDFNAPRGQEVWDSLAIQYTDNIPKHITTTVDQEIHKVKGLQLVVDGMFSTAQYSVEDTQVIDGLSDHMAVVAVVRRL